MIKHSTGKKVPKVNTNMIEWNILSLLKEIWVFIIIYGQTTVLKFKKRRERMTK